MTNDQGKAIEDSAVAESAAVPFTLPVLVSAVRDLLDAFASNGAPPALVSAIVGPDTTYKLSQLHFYLKAHGFDLGVGGKALPDLAGTSEVIKRQREEEAAEEVLRKAPVGLGN